MVSSSFFMPGFMELIALLALGGGGIPLGVPPAPENPMMAQVAPETCLFYTAWSGMAEPDANSDNQLEQLLAEREVQHFAAELEKQIMASIHRAVAKEEEAAVPLVNGIAGSVKTILTRPTAIFLSEVRLTHPVPEFRGGVVVNVGPDAAKMKQALATYHAMLLGGTPKEVEIEGQTWYRNENRNQPEITWGIKGEYLIVAVGEGNVERILDRMETPAPGWLTELRERLPVQRVSKIAYLNIHTITHDMGPVPPELLEALGLDNVTSLGTVCGLDGEGFVTRTLLATDGPPRQMLGALVEGRLAKGDLAMIPADATVALAAKVDTAKVFDTLLATLGQVFPPAASEYARGLDELRRELGIDVRDDFIGSLGDTWQIYNSPSEGGLLITGMTAVVNVKNRERLAQANEAFLARSKMEVERRDYWRTPRVEQFTFAGHNVCYFDSRDDDFPLAPAWCLTDKHLVVATTPQNVKAFLARGKDFKSLSTTPRVAEALSTTPGPVILGYCDTRAVFDVVYPIVPMFAQSLFCDLHREGIDLRVSMLPSAPAIRPHLRPAVTTVRKTANGIETTRRETVPTASAGPVLPMFFTLGMRVARARAYSQMYRSRPPTATPADAAPAE